MTKQVTGYVDVKRLRKQAGYTQQELADRLGVIRKTVWNWESGTSQISLGNAEKLSQVFQISMDDLLRYRKEISRQDKQVKRRTDEQY
ncbi:TPA: helix-turn-helix transcriptional regulator [Streptococcus agalactiae]|nr:helix-turn-helix transcriptional regulator [Streptococcus agalactiae]